MKLFLLNSMENNKFRKIGFTSLGFFYNFLHISKAGQKKKSEKIEQCSAAFSLDGPATQRNGARPRPRCQFCGRAPMIFE
jgi:hypothetical protein